MRVFQFVKRYRVTVAVILLKYVLGYGLARYTQMLIHRVSHAGDAHYHWIDASGRYAWTPFWISVPVSYIVFSPLRWIEAGVWHFIPRKYDFQ